VFETKKEVSGIKFIFLPQLLEYLGLLVLIPVAIYAIKYREGQTEQEVYEK